MKQSGNSADVNQEERIKVVENPYYGSGELPANEDFVVKVDSVDQNATIIQKTENVYYEKEDYIRMWKFSSWWIMLEKNSTSFF